MIKKAEGLIYRKLTDNEFKAMNNQIGSSSGGSQTYIDFPKGSVSDDDLKKFFGREGQQITNGYSWSFSVHSLSLEEVQQETLSARAENRNALREQNGSKRIAVWTHTHCSEFPTSSYDSKNKPIIVYIVKSSDGEYWAGWFYRNEAEDSWFVNATLSAMLWNDCGYLAFSAPVYMDTSVYKWPFRRTMSASPADMDAYVQEIYYGAPGSGKSFVVKEKYGNVKHRTTFHPDTDYASFVGTYKPVSVDDKISYQFTPQVFMNAYCEAWQQYLTGGTRQTFLVIEELNRGNCAQIFGDLFQLLDRNEDGMSEYPIQADTDIAKYLAADDECVLKPLLAQYRTTLGLTDNEPLALCLPPTLSIVCTMNTSDQSLYPIDSAFKRRWEWKFVPVDYEDAAAFTVLVGKGYGWSSIIQALNQRIYEATGSPDKQIGNRFVRTGSDKNISKEQFVNKVMFYLWTEIYKDLGKEDDNYIFTTQDDKRFTFDELFEGSGKKVTIKEDLVVGFIEKLIG